MCSLAQTLRMMTMWTAGSLVHTLLDEVRFHTLDDGVDDASVDSRHGGILHGS